MGGWMEANAGLRIAYSNQKEMERQTFMLWTEPWWPSSLEHHTINDISLVMLKVKGSNPVLLFLRFIDLFWEISFKFGRAGKNNSTRRNSHLVESQTSIFGDMRS